MSFSIHFYIQKKKNRMNFRNNQILKKIRNVIYEQQQQQSLFDSNVCFEKN